MQPVDNVFKQCFPVLTNNPLLAGTEVSLIVRYQMVDTVKISCNMHGSRSAVSEKVNPVTACAGSITLRYAILHEKFNTIPR